MKKILICSLVFFVFTACQQKESPKSAEQMPPAALQAQGDIKLLEEAVQKDPKNGEAWVKLGNIYMDTSRFNEAVDSYQKALEIDPKNVDARVGMGICYRNIHKSDMAVKEFRKAIEIDSSHINAHKNLAIVLEYDLNDPAGAIKEFETALQLAPNAPDAARIRAEIQKLKLAKK